MLEVSLLKSEGRWGSGSELGRGSGIPDLGVRDPREGFYRVPRLGVQDPSGSPELMFLPGLHLHAGAPVLPGGTQGTSVTRLHPAELGQA